MMNAKTIEAVIVLQRLNTYQIIERYSDEHLISSERKKLIDESKEYIIRFKADSLEAISEWMDKADGFTEDMLEENDKLCRCTVYSLFLKQNGFRIISRTSKEELWVKQL